MRHQVPFFEYLVWLDLVLNPCVEVSPLQMDSSSCDIYRLSSLLCSLGEPSPRMDVNIHDCVKPRRGFSRLSFMYVLFSFNIFLITHFQVLLSPEPLANTLLIRPMVGKYIYIFTNPSARAGYDTRLIFKRSLIGLNSEFSF